MPQIMRRPPRIQSDLVRGNGVAALGDSITQANGQNSTGLIGSNSWFVLACMASGGRLRFVRNAGVSGNMTSQMLARLSADVIAFAPDWCFVLGGTNDIGQLGQVDPLTQTEDNPEGEIITQDTIRVNLETIYDRLRGASIQPILCTLTPRSQSEPHPELDKLNAWIRSYAQSHGHPLCDFEAVTMDPATGGWRSGYSGDGLHPSRTGNDAMRDKVLADIIPLLPQASPYTARTNLTNGPSIVTLGNFLADANADGVGDGWTGVNTAIDSTPSLVADDGHVFGKWQQLVVASAGTRYFDRNAEIGSASPGDRVAFSGKFSTEDTEAGELLVSVRLLFNGGVSSDATPNQLYPLYQFSNDVTDYVWYAEAVLPEGTTSITCDLLTGAGTGTVRFGEVAVINMTTQGTA